MKPLIYVTLWLTIIIYEVPGAVPPANMERPGCDSEIVNTLQDISDAITSTSMTCRSSPVERKSSLGPDTEIITQVLKQNGEVVSSLVSQTDTLKMAMSSVGEVQSAQQQLVAALRSELENEKQAKRTLRRSVQDLRSELHVVKEETKAWREHLQRLEREIKSGLQKSELAAQEATIEVKSTAERVNSLGEVIRHVQTSLQGVEKTVSRHTSNLIALRKSKGKGQRLNGGGSPSKDNTTAEESTVDLTLERPDEDMHCPHPYARIGLGCFTIHSTVRYTWERARQHCKEFNGDLANPYDLYDVVLFLDESYPGGWSFWVGATLKDDENWYWVSGLQVTTQVDFWGRGEPGEPLENDERCLFLHSWWRFRGGADPCSSRKYFICEMKTTKR